MSKLVLPLIFVLILLLISPSLALNGIAGSIPVCSPAGYVQPHTDSSTKTFLNISYYTWISNGQRIDCTGKFPDGTNVPTTSDIYVSVKSGSSWIGYSNPVQSPYVSGTPFNFTITGTGYYEFVNKYGGNYSWGAYGYLVNGTNPINTPVAAFSGTPLTGYVPLSVGFSDSSSNTPTSWYWDFGDGYNSTLQNPGHLFNNSGSYTVSLRATNTAGSDWENKTSYVTVNSYQLPVCSAVVQGSTYQGNSPLHVWMNDTSTNDPTAFYWDFNYQDFGWFTISPNELNTTADPDVIITGTGTLPVYHYVSNPAGTAYCPMYYFNISGAVPTPTPTPAIPFPNQTGVCVGSSISLGSNAVTDFPRYSYVTDPDGNIFSDFFDSGDTVILSGSSLTRKLGQYYYAEKNESQQLLWQSSYVTVDCSPTPTQTYVYSTVPTPHVSLVPTQTPIPMITTFSPNANLNSSIVPLHLVIPTLEPTRNTTGDVNITQMKENILELSPLFAVYINTTEIILYPIYNFFVTFFTWVFSLLFFVNWGLWAINTFQTMLYSFTDLLYVTLVAFSIVISNIPIKVQNVITFCLLLDFIRQLYNLKRGDRL